VSGVLGILAAGGEVPINFQPATASDSELFPTDSTASVSFGSTGALTKTGNGSGAGFDWLRAGAAADFDIRVTATGDTGSMTGPTLSTWHNLGTTRTWLISETAQGTKNVSGTYEIGYTGSGVALGSAAFELQALSDI
jgi:hypothetical protein